MEKKDWKTLCMGAVIAIGGIVGLTSCENKNENQDENKKPDAELVKETRIMPNGDTITIARQQSPIYVSEFGHNYSAEKKDTKDGGEWKIEQRQDTSSSTVQNDDGKLTTEYKFQHEKSEHKDEVVEVEFGYENALESMSTGLIYGFDGPVDNPKVLKNKLEEMRKRINPEYTLHHVGVPYKDEFDVVHFDYVTPNSTKDNSKKQVEEQVEEQVSAKQDRPEKKEPPKGSISKDAFINALLEQQKKSGGRGGKKS